MSDLLTNLDVIDAAIAVFTLVATLVGLAARTWIQNRTVRELLIIAGGHAKMAVMVAMTEWRAGMVEARVDGVVTPDELTAVRERALSAFWDAVRMKKLVKAFGQDADAVKRWGDNLVSAEIGAALRGEKVAPAEDPPQGR